MLIVSQMDVSFGQKSSGFHTKPFCSPKGRGESQHRVYSATILPQSGLLGQHLS